MAGESSDERDWQPLRVTPRTVAKASKRKRDKPRAEQGMEVIANGEYQAESVRGLYEEAN